ncbi:MAG: DinB family protein, partial [Candidatus Kariarchaeaceae archaeon]
MEIQSIDTFLSYADSVRRRTVRVIDQVPADKIDWKPHETAFSFADIIRHISTIEYNMFGRNVQLLESAYPG